MEDSVKKMFDLGVGLMSYSREKISEAAKQWAEERKMTPAQTREFIHELVQRGEQNRQEIQNVVQESVQRAVSRIGLGDKGEEIRQEIALLRQVVTQLDARLQTLEARLATETPSSANT